MINELPALERKLEGLADAFEGRALRAAITKAGGEGKKLAAEALKGDIGDMSMSNWRRGKPINLAVRYDVKADTAVEIGPNKRAAGPWRVLEEGRKSGTSKGSRKRAPRPVSSSRGKSTWSDATERMEKELPIVVADAVRDVLRKTF